MLKSNNNKKPLKVWQQYFSQFGCGLGEKLIYLKLTKKNFKKLARSILASLVADYAALLPTAGGKILLILKQPTRFCKMPWIQLVLLKLCIWLFKETNKWQTWCYLWKIADFPKFSSSLPLPLCEALSGGGQLKCWWFRRVRDNICASSNFWVVTTT